VPVVNKKDTKEQRASAIKQHVQCRLLQPHCNKKNPYAKQYRVSRL